MKTTSRVGARVACRYCCRSDHFVNFLNESSSGPDTGPYCGIGDNCPEDCVARNIRRSSDVSRASGFAQSTVLDYRRLADGPK
jgi:hypothetical protein